MKSLTHAHTHTHTHTQQNQLLEKIDTERHSEFKRAEMQAEHRRREMLKTMDEKRRLQAEEEFQNQQKKLRSHEKLHHPASEQQLEDVWEKEDGLDKDNFDPRTFFHLHDKNSDRQLDAMEWESMFYNEVRGCVCVCGCGVWACVQYLYLCVWSCWLEYKV